MSLGSSTAAGPSSGLIIEPLRRRDLRAVEAIEQVSFPEPWPTTVLRSELDAGDSRRYTKAVLDRRLVGYLGLMFVEDEVHVNTIATHPDARHKGVATRLLLEGIEASIDRGARHITLEVAESNLHAQTLYRRFGLAPVGVRKGYYRHNEDAFVMWLRDADQPSEIERRSAIEASLGSSS